jgi:cell division septation protein DedD
MPASQKNEDTEITLGTGKLLVLFFTFSAICAVFFAIGFLFGKNSTKTDLTPVQTSSTSVRQDVTKPSTSLQPATSSPSTESKNKDDSQTSTATPTDAAPATTNAPAPTPTVGIPPTNGYFVQVAAVSKQEDADALIDALKKKQYPAFLPENAPDKLFHVQIGPFADIKDAESIRARVLSDGYNPIIKK